MSDDLETLLVGLSEFQARLIKQRHNMSYRRTAGVIYLARVDELRQRHPDLAHNYEQWYHTYDRLFKGDAS